MDEKDIKARLPRLETVTAMFADSNGIMRGKTMPASHLGKILNDGLLLPMSVFGVDATGESVAATGLVWETGDADTPWRVVPDTFFEIPGSDGRGGGVLMTMLMEDASTPHALDPRGILGRAIARIEKAGIYPVIAPELEFYLIDARNDALGMGRPAIIKGMARPQQTNQVYGLDAYGEFAEVLDAIGAAARAVSVAAEAAISEYGHGQFEINIGHNADILRAADDAALLRHLARRVARAHGYDTTFMGKPFGDDTGSGFHLHASLWDKPDSGGNNILAEKKNAEPWQSPVMAHAAGGCAEHLAASMAVFAPNANAWRRLQPGHYAPTDRSWGYNNRTVNFRIPAGAPKARRLEHRAASADVNPYLAITLILGAMVEGIEGKIFPPEITTGNAHERENRAGLPGTWREALAMFRDSDFIARWLGEEYRHVFFETKDHERRAFEARISPLDWAWYR